MYTYGKTFFKKNNLLHIEKQNVDVYKKQHKHDFLEIVYVSDGKGKHYVDGVGYEVNSGSLIFINYNQAHAIEPLPKMTIFNILIDVEAASKEIITPDNAFEILSLTLYEDFCINDFSKPFISLTGREKMDFETILMQMHNEYPNTSYPGYDSLLKSYLSILLIYIYRAMAVTSNDNKDIMEKISEYIEENLEKHLTIEHLATKCFYSPKYFNHIFKECFGITIAQFIQKKRIEESARLLVDTDLSVNIIAEKVGYANDVRFYRYFKKYNGMTPNEYRKKYYNIKTN